VKERTNDKTKQNIQMGNNYPNHSGTRNRNKKCTDTGNWR